MKFIHCADVHLDTPLQGLAQYPGAPVNEIRNATAPPSGGKGTRLLGEGEDQLAADLVLVVPEAGVDRVEWAKHLVHNAVRSPHTQQAYEYALEQFFQWAAGR